MTTTLDELERRVEQLSDRVDELEDENDRLRAENEELHDRVEELEQHTARERAQLAGRISDVEKLKEQIDAGELGTESGTESRADGGGEVGPEPQTYLETVVKMDESTASESLTPNQERARFVVRDVMAYSDHAPGGGRVLTSGRIGRVLRAGLDTTPHSETVGRVIEFIDEMGEGTTSREKRRGKWRLSIDPDAARRLERLGELTDVGSRSAGGGNDAVIAGEG